MAVDGLHFVADPTVANFGVGADVGFDATVDVDGIVGVANEYVGGGGNIGTAENVSNGGNIDGT